MSPLKYVRAGELPLRFLALKDREGDPAVKLALFQDDAKDLYRAGDVVRVDKVYVHKGKDGYTSLSTKRASKIEVRINKYVCDNVKLS